MAEELKPLYIEKFKKDRAFREKRSQDGGETGRREMPCISREAGR